MLGVVKHGELYSKFHEIFVMPLSFKDDNGYSSNFCTMLCDFYFFQNFQIKEQIGQVAQATVFIVERQPDKQKFVLKKVILVLLALLF